MGGEAAHFSYTLRAADRHGEPGGLTQHAVHVHPLQGVHEELPGLDGTHQERVTVKYQQIG